MKVTILGSTPEEMFGYDITASEYDDLRSRIENELKRLEPTKVYTTLRLGVETIGAEIAVNINAPLHIVIPYVENKRSWALKDIKRFDRLMNAANKIDILAVNKYSLFCRKHALEYMVKSSDVVIVAGKLDKDSHDIIASSDIDVVYLDKLGRRCEIAS